MGIEHIKGLVFSVLSTPDGHAQLSYFVRGPETDPGEGPVLIDRTFRVEGGFLVELKNGCWVLAHQGLADNGPHVPVSPGEHIRRVISREFELYRRVDAKLPNPQLLVSSGRPKSVGGGRVQVYLDAATVDMAKSLGDGNLSQGLRNAVWLAYHGAIPVEPGQAPT